MRLIKKYSFEGSLFNEMKEKDIWNYEAINKYILIGLDEKTLVEMLQDVKNTYNMNIRKKYLIARENQIAYNELMDYMNYFDDEIFYIEEKIKLLNSNEYKYKKQNSVTKKISIHEEIFSILKKNKKNNSKNINEILILGLKKEKILKELCRLHLNI